MHFQGFIHPLEGQNNIKISPSSPLPSISLDHLKLSQKEVVEVFHLPFIDLLGPTPVRLRSHRYRDMRPYWAVDVSDKTQTTREAGEIGGRRHERLEIWGLTGWYLSLLMRTLEVW